MRAWSLQRKIQVTQTRIIEWIGRYDWNVYISFSGGKDSTVLADLTARAYQAFWCPNRKEPLHLVFVNTGLEYPEIQKFVKYFAKWLERKYEIPVDLKVLTPELTFPEVLTKYGYPAIGKEVAKVIYYARHGSQSSKALPLTTAPSLRRRRSWNTLASTSTCPGRKCISATRIPLGSEAPTRIPTA